MDTLNEACCFMAIHCKVAPDQWDKHVYVDGKFLVFIEKVSIAGEVHRPVLDQEQQSDHLVLGTERLPVLINVIAVGTVVCWGGLDADILDSDVAIVGERPHCITAARSPVSASS